ncbi:MAG: HAD family hydrolase [Elusimicrobiales bacterium]|nr:HAD family hydrolase [Elusimicrobiales bacterium]
MINNIIFDLDGTLIDSKVDIVNSFNIAVKEILNIEELKDPSLYIGYSIKDMVLNLYPKTEFEKIDMVVSRFRYIYDNSNFPNTKLFPNVIKLLEELQRRKKILFLLTNKPSKATFLIIEKFKIKNYFKAVFTRDMNPKLIKEKCDLLKDLIDSFNLRSNETLLIGDSEVDIIAANKNNILVGIVKNGYGDYDKIKKMNKNFIFDNILEVIKVL